MQRIAAFFLASALAAGQATAQTPYEPPPADEPQQDGLEGEIENGLQGIMEKLLNEARPHLEELSRDLNDTVSSFAPVFDELGDLMDDVGNYETPERLENGDILIRRRADAPPPPHVGETLRDLLDPGTPAPSDTPEPPPPSAMPEEAPLPDAPEPMPEPGNGPEIEL